MRVQHSVSHVLLTMRAKVVAIVPEEKAIGSA